MKEIPAATLEAVLKTYGKMTSPPDDAEVKSVPVKTIKRLLQEMRRLSESPHPSVQCFPNDNCIMFWRLLLEGPEGTPCTFMLAKTPAHQCFLYSFHVFILLSSSYIFYLKMCSQLADISFLCFILVYIYLNVLTSHR